MIIPVPRRLAVELEGRHNVPDRAPDPPSFRPASSVERSAKRPLLADECFLSCGPGNDAGVNPAAGAGLWPAGTRPSLPSTDVPPSAQPRYDPT